MKQEDKDLLLQDLCARLPYGVKGYADGYISTIEGINVIDSIVEYDMYCQIAVDEFTPYLFPLSSMTEEQKEEYNQSRLKDLRMLSSVLTERISDGNNFDRIVVAYNEIDWLNKNHFDYRGLIPMGLAVDATGLNIY